MSQVGRIGGQVLSDNLLRAGVDLAFETSLLYLNVTTKQIGIKKTNPVYDLDVNSHIRTTNLTVDTQLNMANLKVNSPNTISTIIGGIDVYIKGGGEIFHDILTTDNLVFNGNTISSISNSNIIFDPNGSGTVEFESDTNITGNLKVTGNINMNGNLKGLGTLTLGDQIFDTVTVNTDFTQSIIPGTDLTYDLGKTNKRWAELHSPTWDYITTGLYPGDGLRPASVTISDQITLDGVTNKISAIQSNEDVLLSPDTGIVYIEQTKWQDSDITNLLNTPLTLATTGTGYYKIADNSAVLIPAGDSSERQSTPVVGETRWNTDLDYLECFDGTVWSVSTGGGEEITQTVMSDLGNIYTLILG